MARVDSLSDGQPLTYEVINQMITEINKIKDVPEEDARRVEVLAPGINKSDQTAKVIAGKQNINFKANETTDTFTVTFSSSFENQNVVVLCTVVDLELGKSGAGISMANATVISITNKQFEVRVKTLKSVNKSVNLELHYIAIGAGSED